jgi:type VI secretion system protein ImpF
MAKDNLPTILLPSLKDRLLDPDSMGTADRPGYSLSQIIDSVRQELEELLNTRRSRHASITQYPELARSIVTYGLADLSSMDATTPGKLEEVGHMIETTINMHEPRLRNVKVTAVRAHTLDLRARFHIEAELRVTPSPRIAFETVLELTTGQTSIRENTA